MKAIRFWLNDQLVEEFAAPPTTTLLEYLRSQLRLTGTKEGCAEGDCGACTVALLDAEAPGGPTYRAINSCLLLLPMLHGQRVYTVEALKRGSVHHLVQKSLVEHLGSQCGYCTPGVVMSLFEACYRTDLDAAWKLDDQMCGNLCRCTGYRPIRDAAVEIAGARPDDHFGRLLAEASPQDRGLAYEARGQRFFQPTSVETLLDLLVAHPDHRLVSGATDLGLEVTKRHTRFSCLVSLGAIPALRRIEPIDGGWAIGSAARLSDVEAAMGDPLPSLARMLHYFGSRQIKHGATLGGNLCTASPIGDSAPMLLALGATAIARSHAGERAIP
ncbi:MAG: FAD binding domain-containing protein, partial [Deltaproteobacteria bacterium]|nr:FAD binding domain-containing protein [Deltaproteobacteria bacterium]